MCRIKTSASITVAKVQMTNPVEFVELSAVPESHSRATPERSDQHQKGSGNLRKRKEKLSYKFTSYNVNFNLSL
jgi:hypothetical protein